MGEPTALQVVRIPNQVGLHALFYKDGAAVHGILHGQDIAWANIKTKKAKGERSWDLSLEFAYFLKKKVTRGELDQTDERRHHYQSTQMN